MVKKELERILERRAINGYTIPKHGGSRTQNLCNMLVKQKEGSFIQCSLPYTHILYDFATSWQTYDLVSRLAEIEL